MKVKLNALCLLATIVVSLGVSIGLNNSRESQQATAIFAYAAGAGEFAGDELTAKQRGISGVAAVGTAESAKYLGGIAFALGWCPAGWIIGAAAVTMAL